MTTPAAFGRFVLYSLYPTNTICFCFSESVISFQSTQTESSRPASARSTYEEQLAKGDMAMKKFTFSGNPEKKDQMIYKHLAPTDKMMLKKRFDGLVGKIFLTMFAFS